MEALNEYIAAPIGRKGVLRNETGHLQTRGPVAEI
jgi:hypothetical protein